MLYPTDKEESPPYEKMENCKYHNFDFTGNLTAIYICIFWSSFGMFSFKLRKKTLLFVIGDTAGVCDELSTFGNISKLDFCLTKFWTVPPKAAFSLSVFRSKKYVWAVVVASTSQYVVVIQNVHNFFTTQANLMKLNTLFYLLVANRLNLRPATELLQPWSNLFT